MDRVSTCASDHAATAGLPPEEEPPSGSSSEAIIVAMANRQSACAIREAELAQAVKNVLCEAGRQQAEISLAVVDHAEMRRLNRQFLNHDYPTDTLSFVLDDDGRRLEGQIVVSAAMAADQAANYGWDASDELLLYAIHAALHLVGHDDADPAAEAQMRGAELRHLAAFGRLPRRGGAQPQDRAAPPTTVLATGNPLPTGEQQA